MNELTLYRKMRDLLSDRARWCQGTDGTNGGDGPYCILGAANVFDYGRFIVMEALRDVIRARGWERFAPYNDETDHARVISALDEAIAILEAAEHPATCSAVKKLIDDAVNAAPALEPAE